MKTQPPRTRRHARAVCALVVTLLLLCCVLTPTGSAQPCLPPPEGIIAGWPGETDGNDLSGNTNHAQLQNGAQAGVAGHVGGAFQFDGIDDVAQTAMVLPPQGTIELWVNPATLTGTHSLFGSFGLANGNDRLWISATGPGGGPGVGPNRLAINLGDRFVNDIDIPTPLSAGVWTHLALTFDYVADSYTLYVDGQAVPSSSAPRNAPTQAVQFGGVDSDFGQTFFFPGLLDEVTVYNRVLEESEIQAIVAAGSAGKCPPPPDTDADGVPDTGDLCPTSDLHPTVMLDSCDSGVNNPVFPSGCTLADLLHECTESGYRPPRVISCVRQPTNILARLGILTDTQQSALVQCVE